MNEAEYKPEYKLMRIPLSSLVCYEVPIVRIWEKMYLVIMTPNYIMNFSIACGMFVTGNTWT